MKIYDITDQKFRKYGRSVTGINLTDLVQRLQQLQIPEGVTYVASVPELEETNAANELWKKAYGEYPMQVGYCIGHNVLLNAVEYHRCSEFIVAATDLLLILGSRQDITVDFTYETSLMETFFVPQGQCVELYATTLHYAPCNAKESGFLAGIILPKGTNTALSQKHEDGEDGLMVANNKWLIAHPESGKKGRYIGLVGENLDVTK